MAGEAELWSGTQSGTEASLAAESFLTLGNYKVHDSYWKVEESVRKLMPKSDLF